MRSRSATIVAFGLAIGGCRASAPAGAPPSPTPPPIVLAPGSGVLGPGQRVPEARIVITAADIEFMSGMIPHHAQAVLIARGAAAHGARADVRVLCERIVIAQRDEIRMMQGWLRDHGLPVPDSTATRHRMTMNGMTHDMLMPGMLTDEQIATLDKARGPEWDRLFLTAMIAHHEGAIAMVRTLLASPGAAQDPVVSVFATEVEVDQSTEIHFMKKMLGG
jgi:uncharacterized protein (DUF305 family)